MKPGLGVKRDIDVKSPARLTCAVFGIQNRLKTENPPPKKIRRSMTFGGGATSADDEDSSSVDPFQTPEPLLPSFLEAGKDMIRRITSETVRHFHSFKLAQAIRGDYKDKMDEIHIIDCRYPYEYQGGHIQDADNLTDVADIEQSYFGLERKPKRCVLVFHCEYSIQRAPQMQVFIQLMIGHCISEDMIET
jgi:rhodanese-related sulfurtransferase